MSQLEFKEEILHRLQEQDPRYDGRAYLLVLASLNHVMDGLTERRHITGRELAEGLREVAIQRFGLMARAVLADWGMDCTEDVGRIVFALVECGVLVKQDEDRIEDFRGVFDFREAFEDAYPWGAHLR
jgi:uncharacterized repeat protein (TIGR04138 family)